MSYLFSVTTLYFSAVNCDVPPAISNAVVRYDSTTRKAMATYVCSKGYKITGPQSVTCTDQGKWTTPGVCEPITCSDLPSIQNAMLVSPPIHLVASMQPFIVGAELRFACRSGYSMLTGSNSTVTCQTNGEWTELPVCIGNENENIIYLLSKI